MLRLAGRSVYANARRMAVRHSSSGNGSSGSSRNRNKPDAHTRNDDRFQYDMKAPELDAGFANVFQADPNQLSVAETLATGFRLSSGRTVHGPLLLVNNTPFVLKIAPPTADASGRVANPLGVLPADALALLGVVAPRPELLVVGGGAHISRLAPAARAYLTQIGVNVELASTRHAASTFNALAQEGRNAALLAIPAGVSA
ncbi:hypothetical protein LPJ63_000628 [Coemansia sp. RSA 2711]|nr:hypothetical protein LPJ63_000628 [Coemansia sp. RSA 2711]KAJ2301683.1 hypothetical protein IWW54_006214 [Coemansia sp. RSA 2705]